MAIPFRGCTGHGTYFITASTYLKQHLLQSERTALLFIDVLYHYRGQDKYLLHEFVVMPDHFHLLLTVELDTTIERAMQFVKGGFAFRAGRELGFRAPVWQRGFSEVRILNPEAYCRAREYIRNNPVAKHLVSEAVEFPYSSAHPGFELDPPPQGLKPLSNWVLGGMAKAMP